MEIAEYLHHQIAATRILIQLKLESSIEHDILMVQGLRRNRPVVVLLSYQTFIYFLMGRVGRTGASVRM